MQKIIGQKNCRFSKTGVKIFKPLYAKNHKSEKNRRFSTKNQNNAKIFRFSTGKYAEEKCKYANTKMQKSMKEFTATQKFQFSS